jgi:hypothetical protein
MQDRGNRSKVTAFGSRGTPERPLPSYMPAIHGGMTGAFLETAAIVSVTRDLSAAAPPKPIGLAITPAKAGLGVGVVTFEEHRDRLRTNARHKCWLGRSIGSRDHVRNPSLKSERNVRRRLTALQGEVAGADQMADRAVAVAGIDQMAIDRRVKCVAGQVPLISGHNNARRLIRADFWATLHRSFDDDRRARIR